MTISSTDNICVFCGSKLGVSVEYASIARELGKKISQHRFGLVYGGADVGLMKILADAALTAKGHVIGVIPERLQQREIAHPGLSQLHIVADMHARKAKMAALSQGFIALPGGLGTLEELFEVWTWSQLGFHNKPIVLINHNHFYDPLIAFINHAAKQGFIHPSIRDQLLVHDTVDNALRAIKLAINATSASDTGGLTVK